MRTFIHPSKSDSSFIRPSIHPFWRVNHLSSFVGWMSLSKKDSPFKKGESPSLNGESSFWKVNRQEVWVEKGRMKGESYLK